MLKKLPYLMFVVLIWCASTIAQTAPTPVTASDGQANAKALQIKGEADDFRKIRLWITSRSESSGSIQYTARAVYRERNVGFVVEVPKVRLAKASVMVIRSTGAESDNFLNDLIRIYEVKRKTPAVFAKEIKFSFVDLGEFARSLGGDVNIDPDGPERKLKLFFGVDENSEAYININEEAGTLELAEKDLDYREDLIKELSQKPPRKARRVRKSGR